MITKVTIFRMFGLPNQEDEIAIVHEEERMGPNFEDFKAIKKSGFRKLWEGYVEESEPIWKQVIMNLDNECRFLAGHQPNHRIYPHEQEDEE